MALKPQKQKYTQQVEKFTWNPMSIRQSELRDAILQYPLVFSVGPPGTGKSHVSVMTALELLDSRVISKIILVRPMVAIGEELGFMPGDLSEKIGPYLQPIYDIIDESNHPKLQTLVSENSPIEAIPVSLLRGATFKRSIVLIDDSQNLDRHELYSVFTRLGKDSKLVLTGDPSQCDLVKRKSGLSEAVNILESDHEVKVVRFGIEDIVRHDLVGRIVRLYSQNSST